MPDLMKEFLIECIEGLDLIDRHLVALEERPEDGELLTDVFRVIHTIKGSAGIQGLDRLERLTHSGENLLTLLREGRKSVDPVVASALLAMVDKIRSMLPAIGAEGDDGYADIDGVVAQLDAACAPGPGDDRPAPDLDPDPEPEPDAEPTERPDAPTTEPTAAPADAEPTAAPTTEPTAAPTERRSSRSIADSTIRVDVGLLDDLMNLVGELVLSRNELVNLAAEHDDSVFGPPSQRLNLITSELQEGIMKTRMQPINSAWAKLPRVVRDLSHQMGKDVRVEMVGKETELDRTIIEAIKDPLTHIVRNTVDHGIEDPPTRLAAGKPARGTLTLSASHEGEQVNIEISDDGRGIDAERIRDKALQNGLITAQQAESMTENEIVHLVFQPGFSTAESVTNVSGRGVGMDVVKSNVERIGGTVDVRTEIGNGTTFTIKIPLTLAIIPALTVRSDHHRYAIPQVNVFELVQLRAGGKDRIEDIHGAPVYRLRGRLLPIVDLRQQLGLPPAELKTTTIAVVKADNLRFGLVVDGIEDNGEIVVKPLGRQLKDVKLFSGATIMGDGRVALILDLVGVADRAGLTATGANPDDAEAGQDQDRDRDRRLSVDDQAVIVLAVGGDERVAIALDEIDRLEEIPADSIQRSDGRPVIRYRGAIMPIIDLGRVIGLGGSVLEANKRINLVVCLYGGRTVGLAVDQILDIVHSDAVTPTGTPGTVVIDGLVTDIIDPETIIAAALPSLRRMVEAEKSDRPTGTPVDETSADDTPADGTPVDEGPLLEASSPSAHH